jgi:urease accessory protein
MFDLSQTLALMQFGDSAFPAGGFAFSWGVEGLLADGFVPSRGALDALITEHLTERWARFDRVLLGRAFSAEALEELAEIDRLVEAMTLTLQMREGSLRAGKALIGVASKLGGTRAQAYRQRMAANATLGHLTVVQGLVYRDSGVTLRAAELLSGWTLVTGLVSAATRLGAIGHIEAQASLATARAVLAELLATPVAADAEPHSFTPLIDIAVARGPARHVRMFAT